MESGRGRRDRSRGDGRAAPLAGRAAHPCLPRPRDHTDDPSTVTNPFARAALLRHWDGEPVHLASFGDVVPGTDVGSSAAFCVALVTALGGGDRVPHIGRRMNRSSRRDFDAVVHEAATATRSWRDRMQRKPRAPIELAHRRPSGHRLPLVVLLFDVPDFGLPTTAT